MVEQTIPLGASYNRARYYDTNIGRFLSEDPLGEGIPDARINAYACVDNELSTAMDPLGLDTLNPLVLPRLFTSLR